MTARTLVKCRTTDVYLSDDPSMVMDRIAAARVNDREFVQFSTHAGPLWIRVDEIVLIDTLVIDITGVDA